MTMFALRIVKGQLENFFHATESRKVEEQANRPTERNRRETYQVNGKLVDKEFGLYDNKMKEGDEDFWFEKYKQREVNAKL